MGLPRCEGGREGSSSEGRIISRGGEGIPVGLGATSRRYGTVVRERSSARYV